MGEWKEVFRCNWCLDSGFVFANDVLGNMYVFLHSCHVGKEKKLKIPFWKKENLEFYEPISNNLKV